MTREIPSAAARIGHALISSAGGYLRNTIREKQVTCSVCCAPVEGYERCSSCNTHAQAGAAVADRVAPLVYAQKGAQTYRAMYGYKAPQPQGIHVDVVNSLLAMAVSGHMDCDLKLAPSQATLRWTTVPSSRSRTGEHPLHVLVNRLFVPGYELPVSRVEDAPKGKSVCPQNYEVPEALAPGTHVLVVDDSWVSGGSAQSVAAAVRAAGAESVSILAVARVLDASWPPTAAFLQQGWLEEDYDPTICPWTGSTCP